MSESDIALYDEEALNDELPDAALEIAGSKWGDGPAASVTAAFCSGNKRHAYEVGAGYSTGPPFCWRRPHLTSSTFF